MPRHYGRLPPGGAAENTLDAAGAAFPRRRFVKDFTSLQRNVTGMSKGSVTTRPPAAWIAAAAWSADTTSQSGSYACRVVKTISVSLPGSPSPA
jgi:hypothetical protein